ncbi:polysialyltransferase family glycosyltransferase [Leptolyngbya sp. AN03gr2]|uniref:polysialyltransferase family glycosyltransferase n=1 Tax=unclassified Leptolyngbya TaxID=2650499 RepID=UPI003D31EBFE
MSSRSIKRVVTCQGSIQLVTALSVLEHHRKDEETASENYLVIYDLYAPEGQQEAFAQFVEGMARRLGDWVSIVYLTPQTLKAISDSLSSTSPSKIFGTLYELIGTETADEIYLCRNWQFSNQLLINAYRSAEKICYGDSIGIYFSQSSPALFAAAPSESKARSTTGFAKLLERGRFLGGVLRHQVLLGLQLKTVLAEVPFDVGYLLLPTLMGESPPMSIVVPDSARLLTLFQQLTALVNSEYLSEFQQQIAGAPVSVLLTSNLSEAERMSQPDELEAYCQFLNSSGIEPNSILVIKPHPRDSVKKLQALKQRCSELFHQVIVLSDPSLFFLPFEVFFLAAFLEPDLSCKHQVQVFAVSSACLSLKLLFQVPSAIGFGEEITTQVFYPHYVAGRLQHEQQLRSAVEQL